MYKRFILFIFSLLITVSFAEIRIPKPTSKFFVNDFANVINADDEEKIFNIAKSLYEDSGNSTQLVVVTIDSLAGYSIEEYANTLFNTWGIGSKKENDGVLILLSVGDRKSRIEVGYGLEDILTDSGTGRIQDEYMIPYYKNNNFSNGLVNGTDAISKIINGQLKIEDEIINDNMFYFILLVILSILLIIPIIFSAIISGIMKLRYNIATGKKAQKIYEEEFKHKRKKFYLDEKNKNIQVCTECGGSDFIRCVKGKYLYSKCKSCEQCYQQISQVYVRSKDNYYDYYSGSGGGGYSGGGGCSGGGGSSRSF